MSDIKYFVRTTGERKFDYDLDYTILLDTEHKPIEHYIHSLETIKDYDSVLLEDDLVLCKNFREEIEKVIEQYPKTIINFFSAPYMYYTTHLSTIFSYNQCTYFPKGVLEPIIEKMKDIYSPNWKSMYGTLLSQALSYLGIPHLIYRPFLVQHIDGKSILNNGKFLTRNTIYFKDYLDEVGITMEEAFNHENQKKLYLLLGEDYKKWYKKEVNDENIQYNSTVK